MQENIPNGWPSLYKPTTLTNISIFFKHNFTKWLEIPNLFYCAKLKKKNIVIIHTFNLKSWVSRINNLKKNYYSLKVLIFEGKRSHKS